MTCTCPSMDKIPADKRVILYEPCMPPVAHIYHKDCPKHGYIILETQAPENALEPINERVATDL